jgi:bifunctional non-homologous end joining protein LigD
MADRKTQARFIEPMLLQATERLPDGPQFSYELKLDGFRAQAIKSGGKVQLRSRNNKDFNRKYPAIVRALAAMPDETVIDGEIVALDGSGRPSFNAFQNFGVDATTIVFYAFDVMVVDSRDVMSELLTVRQPAGGVTIRRARISASAVVAGAGGPWRTDPRVVRSGGQPARSDPLGEGARAGGPGGQAP